MHSPVNNMSQTNWVGVQQQPSKLPFNRKWYEIKDFGSDKNLIRWDYMEILAYS